MSGLELVSRGGTRRKSRGFGAAETGVPGACGFRALGWKVGLRLRMTPFIRPVLARKADFPDRKYEKGLS
jgi:hypothetical protein